MNTLYRFIPISRSSRTYYLNRTTFNMEGIVKQITTTTQKPFKLVKFMENTQIPISNFFKEHTCNNNNDSLQHDRRRKSLC